MKERASNVFRLKDPDTRMKAPETEVGHLLRRVRSVMMSHVSSEVNCAIRNLRHRFPNRGPDAKNSLGSKMFGSYIRVGVGLVALLQGETNEHLKSALMLVITSYTPCYVKMQI